VFLAKWSEFIRALGQRYAGSPALAHVKITGVNKTTEETWLPRSQGEQQCIPGTSTCWNTSNDVAAWRTDGYTRVRVESTWTQMADTLAQAFPRQQLDLQALPRAFPPLDDQGNIIPGQTYDPQATNDLISLGITRYGSRFIVQNNGLSATFISALVTGVQNQVTTGYQTVWSVTDDPTYRMNGGTAYSDKAQILQTAVNLATSNNAKFLEIYMVDITNSALQGVIANAHAGLNTVAAGFLVSAPVTNTAGTPLGFTVTALDAFGNTATGYHGTVHFSSTDAAATLPNDYTFTPSDSGVHGFSATLRTAGNSNVTVADVGTPTATGTASVTVTPAAAHHLRVSAPPTATTGVPFAFTVAVEDPFNNTVTGYAGTVNVISSDSFAPLNLAYTFTPADNGVADLSAIFFTGGTLVLTAADTLTGTITGSATLTTTWGTPTVTGASPRGGHVSGGTLVNLQGTNFIPGATQVFFGNIPANSVTVLSPFALAAAAPAHTASLVDIQVVTASGRSPITAADRFSYFGPGPAPSVTRLSQLTGSPAGGYMISIYGTGLANVTQVDFGMVPANMIRRISPSQITVPVPAHAPGTVHVVVYTTT
jgi:hypothetical protein